MHCRDTFDWSPLQYAAHEGNIPAIKWFFQGLRTTNSVMEPTMLSTILQCSSNAFTKKVITAQVKCSVIADTSSSNDAAMVSILEQYEDLDARDGARLQAPLHKVTLNLQYRVFALIIFVDDRARKCVSSSIPH